MDRQVRSFNQDSQGYRSGRPEYPRELFSHLAEISPSTEWAWDCACGTGQAALGLSEYFTHVEASDLNENQIAAAPKVDNIHFQVQAAENHGFPQEKFDIVCVAQALHWFDLNLFFPKVIDVLKEGGIFACWGYSFFTVEPEIDRIIKKELLNKIDPYWSEKNKILWRGYGDIDFPFTEQKSPSINMVMKWDLHQLINYLKSWSAVKGFQEHNCQDVCITLFEKLRGSWIEDSIKEVKMDFCLYTGRKEA